MPIAKFGDLLHHAYQPFDEIPLRSLGSGNPVFLSLYALPTIWPAENNVLTTEVALTPKVFGNVAFILSRTWEIAKPHLQILSKLTLTVLQ